MAELEKYAYYYKTAPFVFLGEALCTVLLLSKGRNISNLRLVLVPALTIPVGLFLVSGHYAQHHLVVAPFWACSTGLYLHHKAGSVFRFSRQFVLAILISALLNGIIISRVGRTTAAILTWNSRDVYASESELTRYIPRHSKVFRNYTLFFVAMRNEWDFVTYHLNDVDNLWNASFDYIVLLRNEEFPDFLPEGDFVQVDTVFQPKSKWFAVNRNAFPFEYAIYQRIR
jgi:hypothetical protein